MYAAERTPTQRAFLLLLLFMQLTVGGVVPVLDGDRELASLSRVTHVESEGSTDCAPLHNHVTCQLCRVAGPQFTAPQMLALPLDAGASVADQAPCAGPFRAAAPAFAAPARAPPLA